MKSLIFLSTLLLFLFIVHGAPPPTALSSRPTLSTQDETSDYATLYSPYSGKRLQRGQPFDIKFSDPATSASEARFSLANHTGVFLLGKYDLKKGQVKQKVLLPNWVAEGTYDFVVSENDDPFGSDDFNMDVVICTVYVGRPRANQLDFSPFRNQEEYIEQTTSLPIQKRAPHPPKFLSPTSNEIVTTGSQLRIRFLDGQLDPSVNSARFVLRPSVHQGPQESPLAGSSASPDGTYKFDGVVIDANVTLSKEIPPGAYLLVAEEFYPKSSQRFQEVASIGIQITLDPASQSINDQMDQETQQLDRHSLSIRSEFPHLPILRKRAAATFRTPTRNQKIITGHHLNVSLVNVTPESGKVKFILEPIRTTPKQNELVLFGRYAELNEIFSYDNSTINARVFFPEGIANGTYNLVAQEVTDDSSADPTVLASIGIQIQQIRPITRKLAKNDHIPVPPPSKPSERKLYSTSSLFSQSQIQTNSPDSIRSNLCDPTAAGSKNLEENGRRDSSIMIEPSPGQEVPMGSKFLCKVQDQYATTETVKFYLRSSSGVDHYLGLAKFDKGFATLKVTCPVNVQYDSYDVLVRQNSVKKPKVFLDVIYTSIVISHGRKVIAQSTPMQAKVKRSETSSQTRMTNPTYNQNILAGKKFDCWLQNVLPSDHVRFSLRTNDGSSDLQVGNCVAKKNVAKTMCQIPSSVTPGTYDLIAQKSSISNPDNYLDVDRITITLANPRGFGPDISNEEPRKILARSVESTESETLSSSSAAAEVSILLAPTAYQTIVQGQGFQVKLKKNTSPFSTKLRFLLESTASSSKKQYVLGTSSNGEAVRETLRCPEHIQSGTYLFVIQANDPTDLDSFVDSSSTPIVVTDQSANHLDSSSNSTTRATYPVGSPAPSPEQPTQPPTPVGPPVQSTNPGTIANPSNLNVSPASSNNSSTLTGPQPIDRSSTPLGPGYARNNNNIFTSGSAPLITPHPILSGSSNPHSSHRSSLLSIALRLKLLLLQSLPLVAYFYLSTLVVHL